MHEEKLIFLSLNEQVEISQYICVNIFSKKIRCTCHTI